LEPRLVQVNSGEEALELRPSRAYPAFPWRDIETEDDVTYADGLRPLLEPISRHQKRTHSCNHMDSHNHSDKRIALNR